MLERFRRKKEPELIKRFDAYDLLHEQIPKRQSQKKRWQFRAMLIVAVAAGGLGAFLNLGGGWVDIIGSAILYLGVTLLSLILLWIFMQNKAQSQTEKDLREIAIQILFENNYDDPTLESIEAQASMGATIGPHRTLIHMLLLPVALSLLAIAWNFLEQIGTYFGGLQTWIIASWILVPMLAFALDFLTEFQVANIDAVIYKAVAVYRCEKKRGALPSSSPPQLPAPELKGSHQKQPTPQAKQPAPTKKRRR